MEISGIEEQVKGQYKEATVKSKMWEILWDQYRLQETYRGILNMGTVLASFGSSFLKPNIKGKT